MTDPAKPRRFRSATLYDGTLRTTVRLRVRELAQMTRLLRQLGAVTSVISARRSA